MTDSTKTRARGQDKRRRLTAAAARVLHERGVERTTLADIADAAGVPVGNVYYYFKTKDDLVRAALTEHTSALAELTGALTPLPGPRARLTGLIEAWIAQRDVTARYGCPTGTLAVELDKKADGVLDDEAGRVIQLLVDWAELQFRDLGVPDPHDHAITLIAGYQGMSLLANALRDAVIMVVEGNRLIRWIDSLPGRDRPATSLSA